MSKIFPQFPKIRTSLPKQYAEIYESFYKSNCNGDTTASSAAQRMERWLHKKVALDTRGLRGNRTLEIGAGTLNQMEFERDFNHYDIIEPFSALYKDSPNLPKVRKIYADISEVANDFNISTDSNGGGGNPLNKGDSALYSSQTLDSPQNKLYNRIISCATLEHILDLPRVVAISCLLLENDGVFSASIPSQGRFLWTLGYKATTGLEFRLKYGLDYDVIMNYEHCNNQREIIAVCEYFFDSMQKSRKGIFGTVLIFLQFA